MLSIDRNVAVYITTQGRRFRVKRIADNRFLTAQNKVIAMGTAVLTIVKDDEINAIEIYITKSDVDGITGAVTTWYARRCQSESEKEPS